VKIRFQADQDLNQDLVKGVQRKDRSISGALSTQNCAVCPMLRSRDRSKGHRVLVSHDFQTMPGAFARFVERNSSPGVLVVPQGMPIGAAVEILFMIWVASDASEWSNRICRLPL
jgi:hypothetical protein